MKRSYILPHFAVTPAPAVPTALTAVAVSSSQINLSWVASAGPSLKDYGVYRQGAGLLGFVTATSFNDTGLVAGTSYTYLVTARNLALVESAPSNFASATTNASGTLTPGQGLTIPGLGFGTKSRSLVPFIHDWGQDGVGNVSGQYAQVSPAWSYPGFTGNNLVNRALTFAPTGAPVGVPHPYITSFLGGSHYNGQANTFDSALLFVTGRYANIPAFPFIMYAAWWRKADKNWSFTSGESTNDQNYKILDWGDGSQLTSTSKFYAFSPGQPNNNAPGDFLVAMGDNSNAQEIPDRNGNNQYGAPGSGGSGYHEPTPFAGNWLFCEVEICFHQTKGPTGLGFVKRWVNGLQVANYAGATDNNTGTTRYLSLGGGIFIRDYGPGFTGNTAAVNNWEYIADVFMDGTGGGVSGANARVIAGNQPTLAASTLRAVQDLRGGSWTDTQIVIPNAAGGGLGFLKGSLITGLPGYLHVVTESGAIKNNVLTGVVA